jgi:hypothetical protein
MMDAENDERPFGVAGEMASLLEAAGSAVRQVWLTVECSNCGERSRVEAPIPTFARGCRVRASASREARPSASGGGDSAARLPGSAEAIERMSWAEMNAVFAAAFVTEID